MTTGTDSNQEQSPEDRAAEQAAFDASFESDDEPVAITKAAVQVETPEATAAEQPKAEEKPAPEAAQPAPIPKADDSDVKAELRKLHGRIGALNDQLQHALKAKETDGKPAVLTHTELKRMKAEFPEMAELLGADIADAMAGVKATAIDPEEIAKLVSRGVATEVAKVREDFVNVEHANWKTDLWTGEPGASDRTPAYEAWRKTMTPEQADAIEASQSPAFVTRKLSEFYAWRDKASKTEAEKQNRLKAAVTPQGTARAGQQTLSDDEALQRGFAEGFNS